MNHYLKISILSLLCNTPYVHAQENQSSENSVRVLLEPKIETQLMSPIVGQVTHLNASIGQSIRKNEELVRFNCDEQNAQLAIANAELASTQVNLDAKLRLQKLQQAGDIEVKLASHSVDMAKAKLALAQTLVGKCSIKSPFNGYVVSIQTAPFQGVIQSDPLLVLISADAPKIRFNAPANWVNWLSMKQTFKVHIDELNTSYDAKIIAINAKLDPVSQTIEVEGSFTTPTNTLLPGMSGTANFTLP